jgi:hypothetical protein
MKKSELKQLIRKIVNEVKLAREASYDDYNPDDFADDPKPNYGGAGKHEKGGPLWPDEDPNLTGQEQDEGKMKDFAIGQMNKNSGAHPGASPSKQPRVGMGKWDDEVGADRGDPKHPDYVDDLTTSADMRDYSDDLQEDAKLGVSTMKKSPDKKDNTQMGYEDKNITSTDKPVEKKEGKKLPIVQKKSNTETDHRADKGKTPQPPAGEKKEGKALPVGGHGAKGLKEEIMKMIRESITEMAKTPITLDASGIVRGGVPIQFRVQDPNSVTGWSLKGYTQRFPDGTPVEAPKNTGANYGKVGPKANKAPAKVDPDAAPDVDGDGIPDSTESAEVDTSFAATTRTEETVAEFMKYNPQASLKDVTGAVEVANNDETPHNTSPEAIKKAMAKAKADAGGSEEEAPVPSSPVGAKKMSYTDLRTRLLKAKLKAKPAPTE